MIHWTWIIPIALLAFSAGFVIAAQMAEELDKSKDGLLQAHRDYEAVLERGIDARKKLNMALLEGIKARDENIRVLNAYIAKLKFELEQGGKDRCAKKQN